MREVYAQRQAEIPSCSGRPFLAAGSCSSHSTFSQRCRPVRSAYATTVRALLHSQQVTASKRDGAAACPAATCQKVHNRQELRACTSNNLEQALEAGCQARNGRSSALLVSSVALLELTGLLLPGASSAGETLPVEFLAHFLDNVEHLGAYGPIVFVATVIGAEMVPLFPTQPLSIASGLLFGGTKGSLLALTGTTTAAILAFQLSRSVGRRLAERVIAEEIGEGDGKRGMFAGVQEAIDSGSFQQQLVAVTLLRLTPVVPFSASNYLLGATPLKFGAYLVGSVLGLSFWCALFASLGGASRDVLKKGISLEVLYQDLLAKAGSYTQDVAIGVVVLGTAALLFYKFGPQGEEGWR